MIRVNLGTAIILQDIKNTKEGLTKEERDQLLSRRRTPQTKLKTSASRRHEFRMGNTETGEKIHATEYVEYKETADQIPSRLRFDNSQLFCVETN